jgi:4-hydroxy-tetrahydrodipicolinate synthase
MRTNIYKGLITALITPFKDNKIDEKALERLISLQIQSGVNGLVIAGSTGEGTSLEEEEYYDLIKLAKEIAAKKTSIIAGLSAVATESAVKRVRKLSDLGIDGIMCTTPHYIRPEQDGIIQHFKMLHDSTKLPLMLYIHLGRTGVDLADSSILKLAEYERIIAIKDAGIDISRPLRLSGKLPLHFSMMTGNDENSIAYSSHGGKGCISVISNILPNECKQLQNYLDQGDYSQAIILQQKLFPLYEALFMESNPIGIKCAMHLLNLCSDETKLPLTIARLKTRNSIEKALTDFKKS